MLPRPQAQQNTDETAGPPSVPGPSGVPARPAIGQTVSSVCAETASSVHVETASSVHVETVGAAMSVSSGQTVLPEPAPAPAEQQVALTKDLGPAVQLDAATDLATSAGQHSQNEQEKSSSASLAQSSIPAQVPPQTPAPATSTASILVAFFTTDCQHECCR